MKINRKQIYLLCFAFIVLIGKINLASTTDNLSKQNILIFIADDLAWNELGCYGGKNITTPNIDQLSQKGILFNRMYSSTTMCCPTRASIYTGLYPMHNGVTRNHAPSNSDIKSIVHYLNDLGYRVGLTGKTHFRPKTVYPFQIIDGFDPNCVNETADYTTDGILDFMSDKKDQPFCLYVCSTNPHVPWTVGDQSAINPNDLKLPPVLLDNKETRSAFSKYLAEVKELDDQFGDVISALKQSGEYENTMIVFCGEQGPQFPGGKWTCWDYGQKSAFIVKLPENGKQGLASDALVQYEDLLPTMIDYLGSTIPEGLDGLSFLPVLQGKTNKHRKWAYGIHNNIPEGTTYPVRSIRDDRYKLIINLNPELLFYEKHLMGLDKEKYWYSWVRDAKTDTQASSLVMRYIMRPKYELYDIQNDPWELNNIADSTSISVIKKMESKLLQWLILQEDTIASKKLNTII